MGIPEVNQSYSLLLWCTRLERLPITDFTSMNPPVLKTGTTRCFRRDLGVISSGLRLLEKRLTQAGFVRLN